MAKVDDISNPRDGNVSNELLDIVGPVFFAPVVAALLWGSSTPTRVLVGAGLHVVVTVIFAAVQWWVGRYRKKFFTLTEEAWTIGSGVTASALPWILKPEGSAGYALIAVVFIALLASDTLFLAVRPNRWWKITATIEVGSFSTYLAINGAWVLAATCVIFCFHLLGGYQAIQDLVMSLRKEREASDQMAHFDFLTKLLNRRGLARHIEQAVAGGVTELSIASIDVDNFKQVNDRYGHAVGDEAIVAIADALVERLGDDWSLARVGGDEFFAVSTSPDSGKIAASAGELRLAIAGQAPLAITLSIGIATGPPSDELWKDAVAALRMAKLGGKNRIEVVDDVTRIELREARLISHRLKEAISEGRIVVWAQPIMRVTDASIHSYECLARWIEPDGTLIPPNIFIPMVEDQSLTRQMGESVIAQACDFATELPEDISVAVNISASHFVDGTLPAFLQRALERTQVQPGQLTIEITESEYFAGESDWLAVARQVRELGVGLSIDDFGSGYSSLERLMQLPFTQLKLDQIIVAGSGSQDTRYLIAGISHFAHSAGVELVAEGVEDGVQWRRLQELDVELCQGFHFARPAPISQIISQRNERPNPPSECDELPASSQVRQQ